MQTVVPPLIFPDEGFTLDISHSGVCVEKLQELQSAIERAHRAMKAFERGDIANTEDGTSVTHVADRLRYEQSPVFADINDFFQRLRRGKFSGATGRPFAYVIINGIGGCLLGATMLHQALRGAYWNEKDKFERDNYPRLYFLDNNDPAGFADLLEIVDLDRTLVVTVSRSGNSQETLNNVAALEAAFAAVEIDFSKHACAITTDDSELDRLANRNHWLRIWLMTPTIGSRFSVTSVAGHLAAAATGLDFGLFLDGARTMDEWTRERDVTANPAYLLAATWHILGEGRGDKSMVIVPYSDRLPGFTRYLQHLVMESVGKYQDRQGNMVCQGLTVYGHKGSTDTHAYIQQLQEGRNDFFVTFIEVLQDRMPYNLANNLTMGEHLHAFLGGLMLSLYARDRGIVSITFERLNERTLGMLVALYERAVAVYAELIDVNAYNQPGVKAYKRISRNVNEINHALQQFIRDNQGFRGTAADVARAVGLGDWEEEVDGMLAKFAVNLRSFNGVRIVRELQGRRWRYTITS